MKKRGRNDEEKSTVSLVMEWPWVRRTPRAWDLNEMCLCGKDDPLVVSKDACPANSLYTAVQGPFRFDASALPIQHGDVLIARNISYIGVVESFTCHNDTYIIWYIKRPVYWTHGTVVVPSHMLVPGYAELIRAEFETYPALYDPGISAWERNDEKRKYQSRTYLLCCACCANLDSQKICVL
jgi:hypothetical protein